MSPRPAIVFIYITLLLDVLSFGMIAPILPRLIASLVRGDVGHTAEYIGLFGVIWAVMQFFCSPFLAALSDRVGRRPLILLSNAGLCLDNLIMALAPTLPWLFLGRVLSGISSSSIPTANAYVVDITEPESRARALGVLGSAFGVGLVLGPALGGWLGGQNARLPFWIAALLSLLNTLFGFFFLPESLPVENRASSVSWRFVNPLASLRLLASSLGLLRLTQMTALGLLAQEIYGTMFVLYAVYRYGWTSNNIGLSLAAIGATYSLVTVLLIGPSIKWFGELGTFFAGLVFGSLGFILMGLAPSGALFAAGGVLNCLWAIGAPAGQSLMAGFIAKDKQGQLQGAINSLRSLTMIIAPVLFSTIFAFSVKMRPAVPGLDWFTAAMLLTIALVWGVLTPRHRFRSEA